MPCTVCGSEDRDVCQGDFEVLREAAARVTKARGRLARWRATQALAKTLREIEEQEESTETQEAFY